MRSGLIGVITCDRDKHWLAGCQDTWLKDVMPDFDVVIVDKTFLPEGIEDTYQHLPHKTKELCRYALKHSYRSLLKIDNDSFARPKLFKPPQQDYAGRLRGKSNPAFVPEGVVNVSDFCSGGGYWLTARAMQIIVQSPITNDFAEDRWVGNTLHGFGIRAHCIAGYIAPTHSPVSDYMRDPGCVVLMQMESPDQMRKVYAGIFEEHRPPIGSIPEDYPAGHPMRTQMKGGGK